MSDNILESGKAMETLPEDSYTDAGSDHAGAWSRVPGNRGMFKSCALAEHSFPCVLNTTFLVLVMLLKH